MSEGLVLVRKFYSDMEAGMVRSLLEAEGLHAFIFRDDIGGDVPGDGRRLRRAVVVPEEELETALDILDRRGEE